MQARNFNFGLSLLKINNVSFDNKELTFDLQEVQMISFLRKKPGFCFTRSRKFFWKARSCYFFRKKLILTSKRSECYFIASKKFEFDLQTVGTLLFKIKELLFRFARS